MADDKLSISEARERIEALKARARSAREKADDSARDVIDTAISGGTAFALGWWESTQRARNLSVEIAGMDAATVVGAVGYFAGRYVSGEAGRLMREAGRASLAVAGYKQGAARGAAAANAAPRV